MDVTLLCPFMVLENHMWLNGPILICARICVALVTSRIEFSLLLIVFSNSIPLYKGAIIFFEKGSQIYKKSASIKLRPPYFGNKNFMTPPSPIHLIPKQALNKTNTLSVVIFWLPTFWSSTILWSPIFLSKNLWHPQYIWDPHSEENDSPLKPIEGL